MSENYSVSPNGNVRRTGPGTGHSTSVRSAVPAQTDIKGIKIKQETPSNKDVKIPVIELESKYASWDDIDEIPKKLEEFVVGRKIVKAEFLEEGGEDQSGQVIITLDNGYIIKLEGEKQIDGSWSESEIGDSFFKDPELFDHVITSVSVETTKDNSSEYQATWFILAEMNKLLGFDAEGRHDTYYSCAVSLTVKGPKG